MAHSYETEANFRKIAVIIPTYNAAPYFKPLRAALLNQGIEPKQILIVDSSSTDGTGGMALAAGFSVDSILPAEFNHGGTRQMALGLVPWAEIVVFLTQDALPADEHCIANIVSVFNDAEIGAAFGRQLPRPGAKPTEAHARYFNYPSRSCKRTLEMRRELGFKVIFSSNSFAAYRVKALREIGGFPTDVIVSEETIAFARLLKAGWKTAYVADAKVYHSHSYSMTSEFRRYFDIGVLHARESWLLKEFGGASAEGLSFIRSEIHYLLRRQPLLIPIALLRNGIRYLGYRAGRLEANIDWRLKRRLSGHANFWKQA